MESRGKNSGPSETDQQLMLTGQSVTCASTGRVVVEQLPAGRLHHHAVGLSRLQRAERHLVVVLEHRPGVQLAAQPEQEDGVAVHVTLAGRPAHLQAAAVAAVAHVDVLHLAGD